MNTFEDIKRAIENLSRSERNDLEFWMRELGESLRVAEAAAEPAEAEYPHLSVEEYLAFELASEVRHEYVGGNLYAMSGVSARHSLIAGNVHAAFHGHLRGGPCRAHIADFKVRLKVNRDDVFYYPDVMVACGQTGVEEYYLRHPKLIVEVLSPSTERIDRREKFLNYRHADTMEEYVLVSQRTPQVTLHRRSEDWVPVVVAGVSAVVEFRSIGLSLPLALVYEDVIARE